MILVYNSPVMSSRAHILLIGTVAFVMLGVTLAGTTGGFSSLYSSGDNPIPAKGIVGEKYSQQPEASATSPASAADLGAVSTEPPQTESESAKSLSPTIPATTHLAPTGCLYVHNSSTCVRDCNNQYWTDSVCNPCNSINPLSERVCYVAE